MSDRSVVYFEPAVRNLDEMDNRMSSRMEDEIEGFLTAWKPTATFEKRLDSHLWQLKWRPQTGSGARGFAGYYDGQTHRIELVLTVFKKTNERTFNARQPAYNERAKGYRNALDEKAPETIDDWLADQADSESRRVVRTSE